jgi:rRNA pseudouridine-1189 N-methylase Emg1 (Nep1/Mra1 family)
MTQQIKEARQPRTHQRFLPILIELFQKTRANTEANQILMSEGNTQRPKLKKNRIHDCRSGIMMTH